MVNSVGPHLAGEVYELPAEVGDSYIIKGYATGETSRAFSDEEIAALSHDSQRVGF